MTTFFDKNNNLQIITTREELITQIQKNMGFEFGEILKDYILDQIQKEKLESEIADLEEEIEQLEKINGDIYGNLMHLVDDIKNKEMDNKQIINAIIKIVN